MKRESKPSDHTFAERGNPNDINLTTLSEVKLEERKLSFLSHNIYISHQCQTLNKSLEKKKAFNRTTTTERKVKKQGAFAQRYVGESQAMKKG